MALEWDLAGLTDEETGRIDAFGAHYAIWVPPKVDLATLPPKVATVLLGFPERTENTQVLAYPVPKHWPAYVKTVRLSELRSAGWHTTQDSPDILREFLPLARVEGGSGVKRVLAFAEKWGPLWICRENPDRFWSSQSTALGMEEVWAPYEEPREFVRIARKAEAVLDAFSLLKAGKRVLPEVWERMGWDDVPAEGSIGEQKGLVALTINQHFALPGGSTLWMTWSGETPRLHLSSGLGFVRSVWVRLAQVMCNAKGIYQCSECGAFYVREGRRPQAGKRNYCPTCGGSDSDRGHNASSRNWYRKKKEQARGNG